ncbi:MAG: hypothetical protein AAFX40_02755 [Cyanobacteria bacterium J06639_1]
MGYYFRGRYVEEGNERDASPQQPLSYRGRSAPTPADMDDARREAERAEAESFSAYDLMCHCLNLGFSFNTLGDGSKVLRWNESGMPTKQIFSPQIALEAIRDWASAKHAELHPSMS